MVWEWVLSSTANHGRHLPNDRMGAGVALLSFTSGGPCLLGSKVLKAQLHQRKEKPTPGGDKVGEEGIKGERACARTQPDLPLDLFKQMPDMLSPRESLNLRSYTASGYFSPNSNGLSSSL